MKIVNIEKVGRLPVYDISVDKVEHYILENGVASHNTGQTYSADNIWIIGRQQDKNEKTKTIEGYHFIINIEKSRYVIEKSKIPISVTFDSGINKWSGLLDIALEANLIGSSGKGKYQRVDANGEFFGSEYKEADIIANDDVWEDIMDETNLKQILIDKYKLSGNPLLQENEEEENAD